MSTKKPATKNGKQTAGKKAKPAQAKKTVKKTAVKKVAKEKGEDNTLKPIIAKFLENKEFLNSRKALAAFKKEHPKSVVSRGYFYSMFKTFGTRVMKRDAVLVHVKTCKESIGKRSYRNYCAALAKASEKLDTPIKPVRFVYFLKYWKIEKGITVIKARKNKDAKAIKVVVKVGEKAKKKVTPVAKKKAPAKAIAVKTATAKKAVVKKPIVKKEDKKEVVADNTTAMVKDNGTAKVAENATPAA